jgi:hypothetical protein
MEKLILPFDQQSFIRYVESNIKIDNIKKEISLGDMKKEIEKILEKFDIDDANYDINYEKNKLILENYFFGLLNLPNLYNDLNSSNLFSGFFISKMRNTIKFKHSAVLLKYIYENVKHPTSNILLKDIYTNEYNSLNNI